MIRPEKVLNRTSDRRSLRGFDLVLVHPFWAIGLPIAGSLPLGWWMARVLDPPAERVGKGIDAVPLALLRLLGHREPAEMGWKQYAFALLAFNAALFVISFGSCSRRATCRS